VINFTTGQQFLVVDSNQDQMITDADNVIQLTGVVVNSLSIVGGNVVIAS